MMLDEASKRHPAPIVCPPKTVGIMRREQDSNLRTSFAGYTLSRRLHPVRK